MGRVDLTACYPIIRKQHQCYWSITAFDPYLCLSYISWTLARTYEYHRICLFSLKYPKIAIHTDFVLCGKFLWMIRTNGIGVYNDKISWKVLNLKFLPVPEMSHIYRDSYAAIDLQPKSIMNYFCVYCTYINIRVHWLLFHALIKLI